MFPFLVLPRYQEPYLCLFHGLYQKVKIPIHIADIYRYHPATPLSPANPPPPANLKKKKILMLKKKNLNIFFYFCQKQISVPPKKFNHIF